MPTSGTCSAGMELLKLFSDVGVDPETNTQREKIRLHIFNDVIAAAEQQQKWRKREKNGSIKIWTQGLLLWESSDNCYSTTYKQEHS